MSAAAEPPAPLTWEQVCAAGDDVLAEALGRLLAEADAAQAEALGRLLAEADAAQAEALGRLLAEADAAHARGDAGAVAVLLDRIGDVESEIGQRQAWRGGEAQ